ncbi:hypothetical protein R3P38DRAFT_3244061 [Favolaschia claudopus]|uniref:Gag protein n=1 Tax=Favolaschia claudopus TaxID=2862362 RepID=A0AAV9Z3V2_9AGAR
MEAVPMFSGDPASAQATKITPSTFLKKFRSHMMDLIGNATMTAAEKDAMKLAAFTDYLEEDSPAEKWFDALQAGNGAVTTWAALEAAFKARFPAPQKAVRDAQEWERELLGMKLTLGELDTVVKVGGADVYAHINFAARLLEVAHLAGIAATASGVWQSRDALPDVLREKIPATQASWITYTDAIKAIDRVYLRESVAKARKAQEIERTVADLRRGPAPMTPVSKMASQMARTAIATPRAAPVAAPVAGAQGGVFGGGGGRGNLFTPPKTLRPEEREHLQKIIDTMQGAPPDDAAGRAVYARRVAGWERMHGDKGRAVRYEHTGYPLSPGTLPPLSGECFGCGKRAIPWHGGKDCPGPRIPHQESTFRAVCARYLRNNTTPVNAVLEDEDPLAWMDDEYEYGEEDFVAGPSE